MSNVGRLLITADDANVSSSIDDAILKLVEAGLVTNVAMFLNTGGDFDVERCIRQAAAVSLHLNISHGEPVCRPNDVQSMVNKNRQFYSPKDFVEATDRSLHDAISRYRHDIVPRFRASEVRQELLAQANKFLKLNKKHVAYNSFHQDMDTDSDIYAIMEGCACIPRTRKHLIQSGALSGFSYRLFEATELPFFYENQIKKMLRDAVAQSARKNGIPFEVALHPASKVDGLHGFTAYCSQRVREFDAWRSQTIASLIRSGRRRGSVIEFSIDTVGGWV